MATRSKFFYLQRIEGLYYLTLTDGTKNFEIGHETDENHAVVCRGCDAALKAVQLYNRRNQSCYLVLSEI